MSSWFTRRQYLWIGCIVGVGALLLLITLGYAYRWTGFGQYKVNGEVQPFKTLWDWLDLLIVPIVLAIGGYMFTRSENQATQAAAARRAQDEALQAYLDQIGQLLLDKESPLRQSEEGDEVRTLARVRTLTVLTRLDGDRRGIVLQFLYESGLITKSGVIVDLKGADVSEADLRRVPPTSANLNIRRLLGGGRLNRMDLNRISRDSTLNGADLGQVNLSRANLSGTDMLKTDLFRANLSGADLSGAFLRETNLSSADLSGAKLVGADLSRAELFKANLSGADLRNADLSETTFLDANLSDANLKGTVRWDHELLRGAKTLAGATMPDGQKYEEWLNSKDREEDRKNDRSP